MHNHPIKGGPRLHVSKGDAMSFETVASTVVVLAILIGLIAFFNRDVFNDPNAQVSAAGEIEA